MSLQGEDNVFLDSDGVFVYALDRNADSDNFGRIPVARDCPTTSEDEYCYLYHFYIDKADWVTTKVRIVYEYQIFGIVKYFFQRL